MLSVCLQLTLSDLLPCKNKLEELDAIVGLPKLKKLSATDSGLRAFPDLRANHEMKELRLNSNLIVSCPAERVQSLGGLTTLDMGSNQLKRVADLKAFGELRLWRNVGAFVKTICAFGKSLLKIWVLPHGRTGPISVLPGSAIAEPKLIKRTPRCFEIDDWLMEMEIRRDDGDL